MHTDFQRGALYPFAVLAVANGDSTLYHVENLETGVRVSGALRYSKNAYYIAEFSKLAHVVRTELTHKQVLRLAA